MSLTKTLLAAATALSFATPIWAGEITINDAYARASTMMSKSGGAFMEIHNGTEADDRLIEARSDVAERVELHTHLSDGNGVMRMVEVEDGFAVPAGGVHMLARGGDHLMFLGLNRPLNHGDMIDVVLVFEQAGEVAVQIPVDLERKPMHGQMQHGNGMHQGMQKKGMTQN
ncbi:copper chaperone PCu(A)C [Actibacterium sp. XHP0104]|uniref:copper chaperone PCu(A)C n=1 Tax=Actibacterium sp. XHP0104 TaxID=2984335 RepID=UPI0021E937B0|nr:copper chaperone PCu(A)C [Actibacterium sp. XHP0104]MCV2882927.1 copper chaperone PCu(A)C [Actibacterium sp. XHP0104]